jgi:hypothetical protein
VNPCAVCSTERKPVEAAPGSQLCADCANEILKLLRQIEYLTLALSAVPVVAEKGRRAPGYGSRSPANDDAIAQRDPRGWYDASDGLGAVATLHMWCRMIREERHLDMGQDRTTIVTETQFLRLHHPWACGQPWVDEYHADLLELRARLRGLTGLSGDKPLGRCISIRTTGECGGAVFPTKDRDGVQCSECDRIYTGHDLARLHVAQREAA